VLRFNAQGFYRVNLDIHRAQLLLEERSKDNGTYSESIADPKTLGTLLRRAQLIHGHVLEMGATVTARIVEEHIWQLNSNLKTSAEELVEYYKYITKTLESELASVGMFVVESEKRHLYQPSSPLFGSNFESRFRSDGIFEIDEAAKCIAFGRATAAVFHLMRAMEIGIRALSRCLNIPDPVKPGERNWGAMLKSIWKGIEAKWPRPTDRTSALCVTRRS